MEKSILLSLPSRTSQFYNGSPGINGEAEIFYDSDPADCRLGSGGGTAWIIDRYLKATPHPAQKRIVVHAGGQSRRLPAYAVTGKALTPIPVLRWAVGERIDQDLLSMQMPLLEDILAQTSSSLNTMIVSGDVLITNSGRLPKVPDADVVCYGIWTAAEHAVNHGVFFQRRDTESSMSLDFMLQKPTRQKLTELTRSHFYLMDIGLWLLSDRAVEILKKKSRKDDGKFCFYDLYSSFGCALGANPSLPDDDVASLSVAVVPLPDGRFYHFGTTRQLLSSTLELQNLVADQRRIMHLRVKPAPSLFVQNCAMNVRLGEHNSNVWIENSFIGSKWKLTENNVVTGVPENDWALRLDSGQCLDMVPVDNASSWVLRPYGFDDRMQGSTADESTMFLGRPLRQWAREHNILEYLPKDDDIQFAPLFPISSSLNDLGTLARWMLSDPECCEGRRLWIEAERISANDIMERANLERLLRQRKGFLRKNLPVLAANPVSIFYQLDLADTAGKFHQLELKAPAVLGEDEPSGRRMRNFMLRSRIEKLASRHYEHDEEKAFGLMRESILSTLDVTRAVPRLNVYSDQIVWGRSPVRIDLAGGWTDTPPYSLFHGGSVVNMAVELNGQPPLQVFIKPAREPHIILRSIDLGASETITSYQQLIDFNRVGSPFSLPKAALAIAGFAPGFSSERYESLKQQLTAFGSGIEITLLSALPAGSGMGTSSILAATVIGSLSDFCGLAWTTDEICRATLALEQLLTSGGGWQDQYGGVLQGVKLLQTNEGFLQVPTAAWLPDGIFTDPQYAPCHLLYYTGLTRTAKGILAEIVKRMFLNYGPAERLLRDMKMHARDMADAIQLREFNRFGKLVAKSWEQNCILDAGTCPPAVLYITRRISNLALGYKLPGAGGGGYLYIVAKDPEAAARIRRTLNDRSTARFTEMTVSNHGLQISRS